MDSLKEHFQTSNEAGRMKQIASMMLRSNNKLLPINYISSNQSKQTKLNLYDRNSVLQSIYKKDTTLCFSFLSNNIGYINIKTIKEDNIELIKSVFKNTNGIIIDLRNYPSYFFPFSLSSYFVSSNTPFAKWTVGNPDNPGEFTFTSSSVTPKSDDTYQGKLVLLVNEDTQGQVEYMAMMFQAGNKTTVIGSQTSGANGFISQITLPGGLKTNITGVGVYYPDGRQTQRVGIIPDIIVKPTIKGILEGRDELLEKAIEIIKHAKK